MNKRKHIFHLAIPSSNLEESEAYYIKLGAKIARKMPDRITLNFFGDQVVCHLAPQSIDSAPQIYPRHFGLTFLNQEDFNGIIERAKQLNLPFFSAPTTRFSGRKDEHLTFFLIDPSNNLLEFKYYTNPEMIY